MSSPAAEEEPAKEMEVDEDKSKTDDAPSSTEDAAADAATTTTTDATMENESKEDAVEKDDNNDDSDKKNTEIKEEDTGNAQTETNPETETSVSGKKRSRDSPEGGGGGGGGDDAAAAAGGAPEPKKREAVAEAKKTEPSTSSSTNRDSDKISVASVAAASQLSSAMGWNGLGSLLSLSLLTNSGVGGGGSGASNDRSRSGRLSSGGSSGASSGNNNSGGGSSGSSSSNNNTGALPTKEQVLQAAIKAVNDAPPFVHLSKIDSAPQLKITDSIPAVGNDDDDDDDDTDASAAAAVAATTTATTTTTGGDTPKAPSTEPPAGGAGPPVLTNDRLACKQGEGEMRGYRMTRASHGVAAGTGSYYYEVVILQPPTAKQLVNSLPPNVRLGKKLQTEMEEALRAEEEEERQKESEANAIANAEKESTPAEGEGKTDTTKPTPISSKPGSGGARSKHRAFGAHVRLGWSMRTGDLQAPVGYDKWSYGVRDILGSKIHCSNREDNWGGEEFGPGDVVGCSISMVSDGSEIVDGTGSDNNVGAATANGQEGQQQQQQQPRANENHIRFFKNGLPMGEFVITKGKREGGAAFIIPDGVYYPAISLYMGATVKVNFGPHFIHPPRKLPSGMHIQKPGSKKKAMGGNSNNNSSNNNNSNISNISGSILQPVSNLSRVPMSVEESSAKVVKEQKTLFFRKADNTAQQKRFMDLVETEVGVRLNAYRNHRRKHVRDVLEERKKRNLRCDELEQDEYYHDDDGSGGGAATATGSK